MKITQSNRMLVPTLLLIAATLFLSGAATAQKKPDAAQAYPSETPTKFETAMGTWDYTKREEMIPMRDGTGHAHSAHLGPILTGYDNVTDVIVEGGYIRVVQDVRGKYESEGDYVMNRPLHGPQNPTMVDHSTDTYDTIDWLVKNIPESNGRVGIIGISYDGFLPLMALVNPHPALKVAVPMNPMVDGWMGDDWFHNGAFRQQNLPYILEQEATRKSEEKWWTSHFDDYDEYMQGGSAGELARQHGLEQVGFWRKLLEHPSYDAFWRDQAVDRILGGQPLKVPVMLVHSLWDQEDIYGAPAVYRAIKPKDTNNDKVFLVLGPWHHGQEIEDAGTLGALKFSSDTGRYFRREILRPFLDQYLKEGAPKADIAPVSAYETGTNIWRRLPAWPGACASGCSVLLSPLYLKAGLKLDFAAPKAGDADYDEYVSDPARPVPFRARPIQPVGYDHGLTWSQWLVDDQREASGRTDVLVFVTDTLTSPLKISGQPMANLIASTSGTDSDWVVKMIDVYPDEVAGDANMGGYQLMISGDIFRGRYRESFETPKAIAADKPLLYRFALPPANHVFLPGHRIMVQIQSSWFPLYDRTPQTFVPNIFWAKPGDYRKATQRIYHAPGEASFVEMPVVKQP